MNVVTNKKALKNKSTLIIIGGPTASGKSGVAMDLARAFNAEIFSSDSRQLYKEMFIGTARPSLEDVAEIKHHFIGSVSIRDGYSVGQFEKEALLALESYFKESPVAIMVGGTGLYLRAICEGLDVFPEVAPHYKQEVIDLYHTKGLAFLQAEILKLDLAYSNEVDMQNPVRLMRALEVIYATGQPFSSFRVKKEVVRPFNVLKFNIELERPHLYERINKRVDLMMEQGLEEEVRGLIAFKHLLPMQTVGYQEWWSYFDGIKSKEAVVEQIKQNTRNYAKRQTTWFKKEVNSMPVLPNSQEIMKIIRSAQKK